VKREPRWLLKAAVLAIHERLLAEHGGAAGVLNEGSLDNALAAARNRYLYDNADVFQLAATYAHSLTRNHPFRDGNKRVAITAATVFLGLNGYRFEASKGEASAATYALSERKLDEAAFAAWLKTKSVRVLVKRARISGPPRGKKPLPRKKKS
jgi:death-on-curing protein